MWREIYSQSLASRAMWACCADSSSDDDEHNTSNSLLLLFADAFVALALLADLREMEGNVRQATKMHVHPCCRLGA